MRANKKDGFFADGRGGFEKLRSQPCRGLSIGGGAFLYSYIKDLYVCT